MNFVRLIILAFTDTYETAAMKRKARRAGINPDTDAEFRTVNELD